MLERQILEAGAILLLKQSSYPMRIDIILY